MSDNNGNGKQELELTPHQQMESWLEKLENSNNIQRLANEYITPERISSLLLGEAVKNPMLYQTLESPQGRASITNHYILANQLGLEPGSALGLLYPVPKRIKGTWAILSVVGYKGYCELARRSGEVKRINAEVFYKEEVEAGAIKIVREPPDVQHQWMPDLEENDDNLVGAYAVVETKDGGKYNLVMSRRQLIARAKRGGSYSSSFTPWKSDFAAMCRKTVLRALLTGGTVPLSSEARTAIAEDGDSIRGDFSDPGEQEEGGEVTVETGPNTSGKDRLKSALGMDDVPPGTIDAEYSEEGIPTENPFG
jgi:recombination protein RecT